MNTDTLKNDIDASAKLTLRKPSKSDGNRITQFIHNHPSLDTNSSYCHFLQSSHFKNTCIIAEKNNEILGFISGYKKPEEPNTLFIWQMAVAPDYRGKGLALIMLSSILTRKEHSHLAALEATITQSNKSSWRVFEKLDEICGGFGHVSTFLDENEHFNGNYDTEFLYRIPLNQS